MPMKRYIPVLALILTASLCALGPATASDLAQDQPDDAALRARVVQILKETPLIDGHIDVPWQYRRRVNLHVDQIDFNDTTKLDPPMHTDLTRLEQGGLGAAFWSVYVPAPGAGPTTRRAATLPSASGDENQAAPRRDAGVAGLVMSGNDPAQAVLTVFEQIDFVHRLAA